MAVTITKIDETYCYIDGEPGDIRTIQEDLTFEAPGHKFHPQYKAGNWDGKIRLINGLTHQFYTGLVPEVVSRAVKMGIEVEVDPACRPPEPDPSQIDAFLETLDLDFDPYDFQLGAFRQAVARRRLLIISPTSSGKSLIIFLITKFLNLKTLVVCPTIKLVKQMNKDLGEYGIGESIHTISAGSDKYTDKQYIVSTWQSVQNESSEYFNQYDVIFGDEVHKFDSKKIGGIMEKSTQVSYRIGLTGTLKGSKTHELTLTGLFGPKIETLSYREMIDRGIASEIMIKVLVFNYSKRTNEELPVKHEYRDEDQLIRLHEGRNKFIAALANRLDNNALILFRKIDKHGDILNEYLQEMSKPTYYIHGTNKEYEDSIKEIAETTDGINILASAGLFSTGVSINNIQVGIFANAIKSRIDTIQSIGRLLRKDGKENFVTLYDCADNLSRRTSKHKRDEGYSMRHLQERLAMYAELGFPYQVIQVQLERD